VQLLTSTSSISCQVSVPILKAQLFERSVQLTCMGVVVDGVTVDNDLTMANTDALDIDSCQQVHIASSISCQVSVPILKAQLFERSVQLTMVTWRNGRWMVSCMGVVVDGVTVDNDLTMANTDALDIDSCQQVHPARFQYRF
jgi:GH24 family phage-related lysozyme (muramidase)